MTRHKRFIVLPAFLFFLLSSNACVQTYKQPSRSDSVATVIVDQSKFTSGAFGSPNSEWFYAYSDENCSSDSGGRFADLGRYSGSADRVQVPGGKRLFIRATFADIHHGAPPSKYPDPHIAFTQNSCTNVISFTPEANHQYLLFQTPESFTCSTIVTEINENKSVPLDFTEHAVSAGCINH